MRGYSLFIYRLHVIAYTFLWNIFNCNFFWGRDGMIYSNIPSNIVLIGNLKRHGTKSNLYHPFYCLNWNIYFWSDRKIADFKRQTMRLRRIQLHFRSIYGLLGYTQIHYNNEMKYFNSKAALLIFLRTIQFTKRWWTWL